MAPLKLEYIGTAHQFVDQLRAYFALHNLPITVDAPNPFIMTIIIKKFGTSTLYFNLSEADSPEGILTLSRLTKVKLAFFHKPKAIKIMEKVQEVAEAIGAKVLA